MTEHSIAKIKEYEKDILCNNCKLYNCHGCHIDFCRKHGLFPMPCDVCIHQSSCQKSNIDCKPTNIIKTKFEHKESYLHKCAKDILKGWIKAEHLLCGNRPDGVWLEYPLLKKKMTSTYELNSWEENWDELWCVEECVENSYGFIPDFVPTYEECVEKYGVFPVAVIDMVIPWKGKPYIAIEVCYKNPVSQDKILKLKEFGVNYLVEVDATWIMSQIKPPKKIKCKILIIHDICGGGSLSNYFQSY